MDKIEFQQLIKECVSTCIFEMRYPDDLNENLQLDAVKLKPMVVQFVNAMVSSGVITSYHRDKTSGDMQPKDFTNDIVHKLLSSIQEWVKMNNDRGNWENNEGGMIK